MFHTDDDRIMVEMSVRPIVNKFESRYFAIKNDGFNTLCLLLFILFCSLMCK